MLNRFVSFGAFTRKGVRPFLLLLGISVFPASMAAQELAPNPMDLFREAVAMIRAADSISVHIEKEFDAVLANTAKVQYSGAMDLALVRKQGLHVDYGDDLSAKEVWYDSSTLTILDHLTNVYVEMPAEGPVGDMLVSLEERYGIELPLAPLFKGTVVDDIVDDIEAGLESMRYLGVHDAAGLLAHHILLRGAEVDLQFWIDVGDQPLLRKMVVTFKGIEGVPQQELVFSDWNLSANVDRKTFKAKIPDGAIKTDFVPETGE